MSLDVSDLAIGAAGLEVYLRRSKTDQEGVGRKVGIPYGSVPETCPIRALKAWLDAARSTGRSSASSPNLVIPSTWLPLSAIISA